MQVTTKFKTVEEYLGHFPPATQKLLEEVRDTIKRAAPQAAETISYNMPAFMFHGMLVYYAAYGEHIGFYPTPSGIEAFKNELSSYKSAKGSVQFPLGKPMPLELIARMVRYRVEENAIKASLKAKSKG